MDSRPLIGHWDDLHLLSGATSLECNIPCITQGGYCPMCDTDKDQGFVMDNHGYVSRIPNSRTGSLTGSGSRIQLMWSPAPREVEGWTPGRDSQLHRFAHPYQPEGTLGLRLVFPMALHHQTMGTAIRDILRRVLL